MKRAMFVIILSGVFLSGCISLASGAMPGKVKTVTPLIPGPYPTPRIPPEGIYYRKRCWPACHYNPNWVSEELPRKTFDFEDELGPGWTWLHEDPSHWTLSQAPHALRITTQRGSIQEGDAVNILRRDAPSGYFDIISEVEFQPSKHFQKAGLFMEMDKGGLISLGRGYCGTDEDPDCLGSGVFFTPSRLGCGAGSVSTTEKTPFLMLRKAGNYIIGYYRTGEKTGAAAEYEWVEVGRCYQPGFTPVKVGLMATNGESDAAEIPADFHFFTLVERE